MPVVRLGGLAPARSTIHLSPDWCSGLTALIVRNFNVSHAESKCSSTYVPVYSVFAYIFNPRRACAGGSWYLSCVTVCVCVCMYVCASVCVFYNSSVNIVRFYFSTFQVRYVGLSLFDFQLVDFQ